MKQTLEFLKKDRRVNKTFIKRLENIGFEIYSGKCGFWEHQLYVEIGRTRVWLEEDNVCRYQNDVIKEIIRKINEQKEEAEEADKLVNDFFEGNLVPMPKAERL